MSKNLYVTVIDLGSNRLKGLVGEVGEKGLRVLASAMMKTKGMENGDISDAVAFKDTVENTRISEHRVWRKSFKKRSWWMTIF